MIVFIQICKFQIWSKLLLQLSNIWQIPLMHFLEI